ncbi:hypothetical protein A2U01_0081780, partial [Trifolium medium]|nr:hypothetical protein [Trifolium medium]
GVRVTSAGRRITHGYLEGSGQKRLESLSGDLMRKSKGEGEGGRRRLGELRKEGGG